jgi:hypothetical protein
VPADGVLGDQGQLAQEDVGELADVQVADAQRQLVRISIDRPAGAAVGNPGELAARDELRSYRQTTFADLAAAAETGTGPLVLDVT